MRSLATLPAPRPAPLPPRMPLAAAALGLVLLAAGPLAAQGSTQPTSAPAGDRQRAPAGMPSVGSPVRLRVAGASAANGLPGLPFGTPTRATFLAADSASLTVRVRGGWEHTVPAADVTRFEVRRGRGLCGGVARRVACIAAGAAVGFGLGYAIDRARTAPDPIDEFGVDLPSGVPRDAETTRAARLIGIATGLSAGALLGGDRWTRLELWPRGARR